MRIAIVWGSTTGSTEAAAESLQELLGEMVEDVHNVASISAEDMHAYDVIIVGASTWDIGELQYDWADKMPDMGNLDWSDKTFAFFGTGDAVGYADTFVDAFGIMWETLQPLGAQLVGTWPSEGYGHLESRSHIEDGKKFLGLALDNDNDPDLTDERLEKWAEQLKEELAALPKGAAQ
ncbi:MAG: flavodoxin [Planctomycetota bacterium]